MPASSIILSPIALSPASPKVDLNVCQDLGVLAPYLRLAWGAMGASCVVTVGKEGEHSTRSRHDEGYCLDLRIWGLQFGDYGTSTREWWKCLARWCAHLSKALADLVGPYVYFVLEKNHIHLEWAGPGQTANIVGWAPGKFFYMTADVRALVA